MFQGEVLIAELGSVDGFTASAVVIGKVTTLAHEVGNDTVENAAFVSETFFTGTQGSEIFGGSWHNVLSQLQTVKYNIN